MVRVSADDVLFATVRARWLESPRQVAADLLEASRHPELLDGVSAWQAEIKAGAVLVEFGATEDGIAILHGAVGRSSADRDDGARFMLALALAGAGDVTSAESVTASNLESEPAGSVVALTQRMAVAQSFARAGHGALATRWADDAVAAAASGPGGAVVRQATRRLASSLREQVLEQVRRAKEAGGPVRARDAARAAATFEVPPWPAVVGGRLLWWPDDQYRRLIRQVPMLAERLGRTWPDHVMAVEAELAADVHRAPGTIGQAARTLVAGDLASFASFLDRENADPRDATAMTAYAIDPAGPQTVQTWPPKPRKPCWCGSGRRYRECCGKNG